MSTKIILKGVIDDRSLRIVLDSMNDVKLQNNIETCNEV